MKKIILALTTILLTTSCSSYYEEDVYPFTEQELANAMSEIKPNKALKEGTFHMQPVSSASRVRVQETIKLKKPNLPPYDVVYVQTDLEDIILELANSSGETVVIPQSIRGRKVTLSHSGANFQEMLDIILSKAGYSYNYINGIWNITKYPVRNYMLEISQSERTGSLDTSEISSDSGDSGDSSSSSSSDSGSSSSGSDLATSYEDKVWTEVDEVMGELIKYGDFKATRKPINNNGAVDSDSNLGNNFTIVDLEKKQETVASQQTLKDSEIIIDDDNVDPWYKITKSAGLITVRAAPEAHIQIEKYLEQLQESLHRQVFVELRIVGISENKTTSRGVQWSIDGILDGGFSPTTTISEETLSGGFLRVSDSGQNLDGLIENLAAVSDLQIISTPQVLIRNNQIGTVKIVNELAYVTTETETETTDGGVLTTRTDTINNKDVGTVLSIIPYIGKNKVQMRLRLSVAQQSGSIKTFTSIADGETVSNEVPTISSNILDQDMIVEYGRIYALGGYVEEIRDIDGSYVPGFNQIPGIAELMRRTSNKGTKTRFIIFVKINRA